MSSKEVNPLRIDVQLSSAGAPQTNQQVLNSRCKMSAAMEDQLAQVKSTIDEALKFVPEQVPAVLAKLSHELRSKAASSASPVHELLDCIAKLVTPKSGMQPTSGLSDSSSGSSNGNLQTVRDIKIIMHLNLQQFQLQIRNMLNHLEQCPVIYFNLHQ
ncbi:ZZ-type zinc finger-containing protein [Hordeum vulgare]|nr:ZZ-type zinc finger-containing protein [Hordeum vulgare]